jgi:hypothetical protein
MDHILSYDAINEAATALPKMPDFLKKAGAKPDHIQYGGPRMGNQPSNAWLLEIKAPYSTNNGTWELVFWPNGTFNSTVQPANSKGPFMSGGKWKADGASSFSIGKTKINGVSMVFTSLMSPTTYM